MRTKFALPFITMIVLVCTILMVEAERANSQPPGKGKKDGGGKMKFDPGKMFDSDWMSKGRGYIVISEMRMGRQEMEFFAKENSITNDKLTKDQFLKYSEQAEDIRKKLGIEGFGGFGKKGNKGDKKKDGDGETKKKGPPDKKGPLDEKEIDAMAEKLFTDFDTNSDGFLNEEEISKTRDFKKDWQKWDQDKNGLISLPEWKAYFKESQLKRQKEREKQAEEGKPLNKIVIEEEDGEEPIIVYRLGKMPAGIPDWFKDLDLDKDGQISLFEWQKAGKDIEEFVKMDRNDDGLLTAEEVVRFQRIALEATQRTTQLTATINGSNVNIKLGDFKDKNKNKDKEKKEKFRKPG